MDFTKIVESLSELLENNETINVIRRQSWDEKDEYKKAIHRLLGLVEKNLENERYRLETERLTLDKLDRIEQQGKEGK